MAKSTNNEYSVLEYLEECVPPNVFFKTFGGNTANVPDIIAADINDPGIKNRETVVKAHYIIIGTKLYLHTPGVDPWNLQQVYENLDLTFEPLTDKLVQISKRPAGANRKSGSQGGGPLEPGDSRHVSFGLRFWVNAPKDAIDLNKPKHQEELWYSLKEQSIRNYVPYATFDAKMNVETQFIGPSLIVNRDIEKNLSLSINTIGPFESSLAKSVGEILFDDKMTVKINNYFDKLGVDSSTFKVVSDNETETVGVPEAKYNSVKFNETLPIDLGLVSITSIKEVKNGIPKKAPGAKKKGKQETPQVSSE